MKDDTLEDVIQQLWDDHTMHVGELFPNIRGGWTAEVVTSNYEQETIGTGKSPREAIENARDNALGGKNGE